MPKTAVRGRGTATDFVRGLPIDLPTAEVIARGRDAGLKITRSTIAYARYTMRHGHAKGTAAKNEATLVGTASKLAQLRRLVLEVGYDAAGEVFRKIGRDLGREAHGIASAAE